MTDATGDALPLVVVGVGRIGLYHARHVQELGRELGLCELVGVVDGYGDTAERVARQLQEGQEKEIRAFGSVADLLGAGLAEGGAVVASRSEDHESDARAMVDAGWRVLLEKPLTDSLESAEELAAYLNNDESRSRALMLAFMRRFDAALIHAREMLAERIGRIFKIVSILEDSHPPPEGYQSPGLLTDMAVHNADEIIWLTGRDPVAVTGTGARLYNQKISSVREEIDDAFVQLWLADDAIGQIQVSRNHVAGYRNETSIYGEEGMIRVGHFQEDPLKVQFEAYGRGVLIERRSFWLRDYGDGVPVFIQRFGPAYKAEVAHFAEQCRDHGPFCVDQNDGLRAMRVVAAGTESLRMAGDARSIA
ncbi:MAG: hypothetical protein CME15_03845 [Gemmatimonadetes bacterium]|nr:hypothetical protein [Gemmatimonadota bacterium]